MIQKGEEVTIEQEQRPENIFSQVDSIEIIALDKEPLQKQLINALTIEAIPRPENIEQMTVELNK